MLLAIYALARVLQVFPGRVPFLAVVTLHIFPPLLFALFHGNLLYGGRGILIFTALYLLIGNVFENLGVLTGFPFGHYYFTEVMGPKLFQVPLMLGLAYVGMGYLSWTLARLILGDARSVLAGPKVGSVPLVASFIMVAWDFSSDPVWSTIKHCWIWRDGGPYFGVPVSNFFGWYLTVYVFYQLFALYVRGRPQQSNLVLPGYWRLAVLFYAVCAAGNILLIIPAPGPAAIADPAGIQWKVSDITGVCALASIFTMGAFAVLAWLRIAHPTNQFVSVSQGGNLFRNPQN